MSDPSQDPRGDRPEWRRAIVTGASSGIGLAFAGELSARGTSLVLVARRAERLAAVAAELRAAGGEVETIGADVATVEGRAAVRTAVDADDRLDLMVNNAGAGSAGLFVELELERETALVGLNVLAVVELSHAAGRRISSNGGGNILTVSSAVASEPRAGTATYAASKAFVTSFGQALAEELGQAGVRVTTVLPSYVATEFHDRAGIVGVEDESGISTAEEIVQAALAAAAQGDQLCVPQLRTRLGMLLSSPYPSTRLGRLRRFPRRLPSMLRGSRWAPAVAVGWHESGAAELAYLA